MTTTILVIDDSEDDQCLYQRAFKDFDCFFSLVMASSAEAGFARLADLKPDLILLDYNLPDMDGLSFMKRLAEYSDLPIPLIMLTGEGNAAVAVEAMKNGVDDYIVKDIDGRYLRLLPGVAGHVMAAHAQREQTRELRKETETLLLRNQILMQNSMDGIHVMDMQGNIIEANDAFCRMLGYTREEVVRLNVADWDAQWSAEELRERFKWLIGKSAMFETVHRRKDGSLIDVEISTSGMKIEGQGFLFAASRDITERKRAEKELKLSAQLLNSTTDTIFLVNLEGDFVYLNEAAWKSRGYTRDEMMAMNLREFNTPEFNKLISPRIEAILKNGHGCYESAHYCKDGSIMPVEINSRVIEYDGQKLLLATIRDITERKQTEAVLQQHKQVIDTSIDGFWMTDMQGYLLEANEAYAKISGYAVEELVNMHISQLEEIELRPEDVQAHIEKVVAQGYDRFETLHRHKDGHKINLEISVNYLANSQQLSVFCHDISERKKVEAALRNSEANLRAMLDNSPYLTWLKDAEGRYITINKVFADYLRLEDIRQAIGKTDLDLQPQELAEKYRADDAEVMTTRHRRHIEESAFDGHTTHWVETYKTPIIDGYDNVLGTVGFARDITERKHMQLKTEALLRRNQALMTSSMDGIHVLDIQGDLVDANEAFCHILGYSREEMAGFNVADWSAEFSGEASRVRFSDYIGKNVMIETLYRRKDGALINVEISIAREEIDGQDLLFCSSRNITERKKTEKKLFQENEIDRKRAEILAQQFGQLLHNSFNEIYLFDANSLRFLKVSEGAKRNLGYSADELEQLTPLDIKPSHTRKSFESLIATLRSGEQQSLLFETVHRRKDGTTYPVEVRLQLMEADSPVFLAIIQDISERSRAESQLREFSAHLQTVREEEKASVAREVHDDLGGTLAALKMDAYWLAGKLPAEKDMEPLRACAKSMIGLLDAAVIATRRIITDLRPTVLDDLGLPEALKWQSIQFQKRTGIECRVDCAGSKECEDSMNKAQLINLFRISQEALTNVARHSGASRVGIELHYNDEEVVLSISDNGRGLPEGHTIASTSYGMRGMRERVVQLGGKIKFDAPPGGGFSVTVILPLLAGDKNKT